LNTPDIAITGLGAVSGFGHGIGALWSGLSTGSSAIRRFDRIDPRGLPITIAAQAPDHTHRAPANSPSRAAALAWIAAREALDQAQTPSLQEMALAASIGWPEGDDPPAAPVALNAPAAWLATELGLGGPRRVCLSACAASTQALGDAARWIRSGRVRQCLVVGADSRLHRPGILGYARLGALETRFASRPAAASRPFDRARGGFVIGEGAGALVLEEGSHARARGARILAWLRGHAATNDAYRLTDPDPTGAATARAITLALQDAGLPPSAVGYLNLHGTGTPVNDQAEAAALRLAFGPALARIAAGSYKSMIGHLAMAAGAVETVGTVLALLNQWLPPNLNLDDLDPACVGPDYISGAPRPAAVRWAVKSSQGFGGQNAAVVLEAAGHCPPS
jgi:3-oxoacyl-[acyl-carrier-protein] synthase II